MALPASPVDEKRIEREGFSEMVGILRNIAQISSIPAIPARYGYRDDTSFMSSPRKKTLCWNIRDAGKCPYSGSS
jgi:hypothetical protein